MMAANERANADLISILSCLERKFDIIHAKWTENKSCELRFRTQIPKATGNADYNALCDEWVDMFSKVTSTTWVKKISNTGPLIRFRKQYQCWTLPGEVRKELLFHPRRCKATVDVKILADDTITRRKNKYIKQGLNALIKFNFMHLHQVDTEQPFAFFVQKCASQSQTQLLSNRINDKTPKIIDGKASNRKWANKPKGGGAQSKISSTSTFLPTSTNVPGNSVNSSTSFGIPQSISQVPKYEEIMAHHSTAPAFPPVHMLQPATEVFSSTSVQLHQYSNP